MLKFNGEPVRVFPVRDSAEGGTLIGHPALRPAAQVAAASPDSASGAATGRARNAITAATPASTA